MSPKLLRHACVFSLLASASFAQVHNYSEAFQKALFFYEIQNSGPVPEDHRVEWRGPSALRDGGDVNYELKGGWYDAGDSVIWTGNDAFGVSMLAWSLDKYRDVYLKTGQYQIAMDRLTEVTDYLKKIVQQDAAGNITRIYCGKGTGEQNLPNDPAPNHDHSGGYPIEGIDALVGGSPQTDRISYWVDSTTGGADVAGAVSAALASASIAFRDYQDTTRANQLLDLAKKVFAWGDANRNKSLVIDGNQTTQATCRMLNGNVVTTWKYNSRYDNYMPRMIYAAAWLHRADRAAGTAGYAYTNAWVTKALSLYNEDANLSRNTFWQGFATGYEHSGAYTMLAADSGEPTFVAEANSFATFWLDWRTTDSGGGQPVMSPDGFISRQYGAGWNTNTLMDVAPPLLDWADSEFNTDAQQKDRLDRLFTGTYGSACPIKQIDYILGSNTEKLSYLAGYKPSGSGYDWVRNLQHKALNVNYGGFGTPVEDRAQWNVYVPYGMLTPGPDSSDYYPRTIPLTSGANLAYQEPIVYTGGILTVLARNIRKGGSFAGSPLGTFPAWEIRPTDYQKKSFFVQGTTGTSSNVLEFEINNRATLPPREISTLGFRYYFVPDGTAGSNVTCTPTLWSSLPGENVTVSSATRVGSTKVWYFSVRFNNTTIVPGEYNRHRRAVRLTFSQPAGTTFNRMNDPSGKDLTSSLATVANIPVYDTISIGSSPTSWKLLGGFEPSSAGYIQWRRAHYNNVMEHAGSVVLIAERVGGSTGIVSATVSLSNGSATAPDDYTIPANRTITWNNGETGEKTLSVPIVDDSLDERRHTFNATLTNLTGGAAAGITMSAKVSIEDNDFPINYATGGTSAASPFGSPSGQDSSKAFDGLTYTKWLLWAPSGWLSYTFGNGAKTVASYAITTAEDMPERDPYTWTLEGSDGGGAWTVVDTVSGEIFTDRRERRVFTVDTPGAYSAYRLNVSANRGGSSHNLQVAELELLSSSTGL